MLALYGHPFSSYTQKVLIALYENGTPFELLNLACIRSAFLGARLGRRLLARHESSYIGLKNVVALWAT